MGRPGECGFGGLGVAGIVVPIEQQIARHMIEQLRRTRRERVFGFGHRRQRLVVDIDGFRGVACLRQRLRNNQCDRLADMAHLALGENRTRRVVARRAVTASERRRTRHIAKTIDADIVAGADEQYARHLARSRRIDALDVGVAHRRAQHKGVRHIRQHHIVGVSPLPGNEPQILKSPYRLTDPKFHAETLSSAVFQYGSAGSGLREVHSKKIAWL
jgi:hypothetical protein